MSAHTLAERLCLALLLLDGWCRSHGGSPKDGNSSLLPAVEAEWLHRRIKRFSSAMTV